MPPKFSFGSILIIITLFSLGLFFKNEITELIYEPAHPAKAFVEKQIKSNPVVVFSKLVLNSISCITR